MVRLMIAARMLVASVLVGASILPAISPQSLPQDAGVLASSEPADNRVADHGPFAFSAAVADDPDLAAMAAALTTFANMHVTRPVLLYVRPAVPTPRTVIPHYEVEANPAATPGAGDTTAGCADQLANPLAPCQGVRLAVNTVTDSIPKTFVNVLISLAGFGSIADKSDARIEVYAPIQPTYGPAFGVGVAQHVLVYLSPIEEVWSAWAPDGTGIMQFNHVPAITGGDYELLFDGGLYPLNIITDGYALPPIPCDTTEVFRYDCNDPPTPCSPEPTADITGCCTPITACHPACMLENQTVWWTMGCVEPDCHDPPFDPPTDLCVAPCAENDPVDCVPCSPVSSCLPACEGGCGAGGDPCGTITALGGAIEVEDCDPPCTPPGECTGGIVPCDSVESCWPCPGGSSICTFPCVGDPTSCVPDCGGCNVPCQHLDCLDGPPDGPCLENVTACTECLTSPACGPLCTNLLPDCGACLEDMPPSCVVPPDCLPPTNCVPACKDPMPANCVPTCGQTLPCPLPECLQGEQPDPSTCCQQPVPCLEWPCGFPPPPGNPNCLPHPGCTPPDCGEGPDSATPGPPCMSSSSSYWGAYARKMNVWGGHMNGTKSIDEGRIPITHGSHQINHFGGAMDFNRTIETNYPPDHCYVADGWLNQEPYKWFFLGDDLTSGAPWFHFGVGYMGEHGADDRLDLNSYALPWIAVEGDRIQYTAKMGTGFSHDGDTSRCGARTSLANLWTQVGWTLFLAAATGPLPWTKGLAISAIADLFLAILEDSANAHHDDWLYRCLNAHYANIDDYDEAVFGAGNRSYRALYPNGTFDVKRFVTHNGDYYKAYSGMFGYEADPGVPPGQRVDAKFLVCWEVKTEGQWPEYQEGGTSYETHARAQAGPCWNVQVRLEA